ncbi:MAG: hypothetical protein RL291_686 [Pseudomonadota bacterium]
MLDHQATRAMRTSRRWALASIAIAVLGLAALFITREIDDPVMSVIRGVWLISIPSLVVYAIHFLRDAAEIEELYRP